MILFLLACKEPPIVDPVEAALAERVMDTAETPMRLFVAVSSIAAEGCAVEPITETLTDGSTWTYTFTGGGAQALGAGTPAVEMVDGTQSWTFTNVGLDGDNGALTLKTTSERASYEVLYYSSEDIVFEADITVLQCEATFHRDEATGAAWLDGEAAVNGTADYTTDTSTTSLVALGDKPFAGLHFAPPTVSHPTAGWAIWKDLGDDNVPDEQLTLEGAQYIDPETRTWPGIASGSNWDRLVDVRLP